MIDSLLELVIPAQTNSRFLFAARVPQFSSLGRLYTIIAHDKWKKAASYERNHSVIHHDFMIDQPSVTLTDQSVDPYSRATEDFLCSR